MLLQSRCYVERPGHWNWHGYQKVSILQRPPVPLMSPWLIASCIGIVHLMTKAYYDNIDKPNCSRIGNGWFCWSLQGLYHMHLETFGGWEADLGCDWVKETSVRCQMTMPTSYYHLFLQNYSCNCLNSFTKYSVFSQHWDAFDFQLSEPLLSPVTPQFNSPNITNEFRIKLWTQLLEQVIIVELWPDSSLAILHPSNLVQRT